MLLDRTLKVLFPLMAVLPSIAWSMQALDDMHLAEATGQDGVTISLGTKNNSGIIGFDRLSLQDRDGFSAYNSPAPTFNGAASIGYFAQNSGSGGVGYYNGTVPIAVPISVILDADGDTVGGAIANASIRFDSSLTRINIAPFSIRLGANSAAYNHNIISGSERDILKVSGNGIDIKFKSGSALGINVQLGNQPQDHFIKFTGGSIDEIANDPTSPMEILSYLGNSNISSSSLKLNFSLKANAASTSGIQLKDMYIDLDGNGMTFGKSGLLDKFDLTLSDIVAGSSGAKDSTIFNDLKNSSIGNFGVIGASVTNLKVNVRGL